MSEFRVEDKGAWEWTPSGKDHEASLSGIRRTKHARLKTHVRQPFAERH